MEAIFIVLATALVCICCFVVGAKVGQKVSHDEPIEMPSVNPLKMVREHNARKEAEMEQDRLDTIIANIDKYDGTGKGQEDVPRG
jgi:hypothetical protein